MALKDTWVNKVDGVDISSANDINDVAQAVIDLENETGSRPDFAANEGEKGFIKNRTHYIDKDGKVHTLPIEFIPEGVAKEKYVDDSLKALFVPRRLSEMVSDKYHRTVEDDEKAKWNDGIIERWETTETYTANDTIVISEQTLTSMMWNKRQMDIELEIPYAVYINGTVYFCIAGEEDGSIYLGNPTLFYSASTQPHNNEPFCITWAGGNATAGMFHKDDTLSYPLTLKVTRATVTTEKKLPKSYLPDNVALKSDIPEGGGGADIDVVAEVGQTIVVEEVDADGKPTKWKAAEFQERTHWSEEGQEDIVPELTFTPFLDESLGVYEYVLAPFELEEGKTYTVIFDGVSYTCTAFTGTLGSMQFIAMGNTALAGGENTGEPFALGVFDQFIGEVYARRNYMVACFDANEHTVRVIEDKLVPHKIPEEYVTPSFFNVLAFMEPSHPTPFVLLTPWEHIIEAVKSGKVLFLRVAGDYYDFDEYGRLYTHYETSSFLCVYAKVGTNSLECSLSFMMNGSAVTGNQIPLIIIERDKDGVTIIKSND